MPLPLPPPLLPHTRIPHTRSSCSKPCSLSPSASAHVHRGSLRLTPSSSSIKTEFWKLLPQVRPSAPWISSLPVSLSPGVLLAFLPMGMGGGGRANTLHQHAPVQGRGPAVPTFRGISRRGRLHSLRLPTKQQPQKGASWVQPGTAQNREAVLTEPPFTTCPGRSTKLDTAGHSERATAGGLVASLPPTYTLQILACYASKFLFLQRRRRWRNFQKYHQSAGRQLCEDRCG